MILYTLSRLEPADSFAVARIDTGSFSEKDIIAKATFDERPTTANAQKRAFAQKVHDFVARENASQYTDITGGLLQAVEFLNEKGTGRKTILIFSRTSSRTSLKVTTATSRCLSRASTWWR